MAEEIKTLLDAFHLESDVFKKARILYTLRITHQVPLVSISKSLNIKPSYLSHYLRLLRLPAMVIDGYYSKSVSLSHLFIISRLPTHKDMQEIYEQILTTDLPTSELEQLVRERLYHTKGEGIRISSDMIAKFQEEMRSLGIEANITQTRVRSTITFKIRGALADSSKKLNKILARLGGLNAEE